MGFKSKMRKIGRTVRKDETPPISLVIGIPTRGYIFHSTMAAIYGIANRYRACMIVSQGHPVDFVRNRIVREFLRGKGTHLLFLDSDVWPKTKDPVGDMLKLNKDVVTCPTPIVLRGNCVLNIRPKGWKAENFLGYGWMPYWPLSSCFEVEGTGFGMVLIRRRVLEKLPDPWFAFRETPTEAAPNKFIGEDVYFSQLCEERGIKIHCAGFTQCGHDKEGVDLGSIMDRFSPIMIQAFKKKGLPIVGDNYDFSGVEQLAACLPHTEEDAGSSPAPAIDEKKLSVKEARAILEEDCGVEVVEVPHEPDLPQPPPHD